MSLHLQIIRCPDDVAPERRQIPGGEFSIGRGPDNDWILADPDRFLSKRHCQVVFSAGQWKLADLSANGTFLNHGPAPLGQGQVRALRDGDRIVFGTYEIEVQIREDGAAFGRAAEPAPSGLRTRPRGGDDRPGFRVAAGTGLEFDAASEERPSPFDEPAPTFGSGAGRFGEADDRLGGGGSAGDGPGVRLPPDFDPKSVADERFIGSAQSDHAPAIDQAFRSGRTVHAIPDDWDVERPATVAVTQQVPRPGPVATVLAPPHAGEAGLLAAFLRGIGLEVEVPEPARTLELVGAALRAAIGGVRQALIARASVKGLFRIEQTMVRITGNNPLKFSAGDDDALAAFLGAGRRNAMPPAEALAEALRDMRLHELATVTAMQSAVRAMLAEFEPARLEARADKGGRAMMPAQRKARAWDVFVDLHAKASAGLSDDFDSVFGKNFARAYEQAMSELALRGDLQ